MTLGIRAAPVETGGPLFARYIETTSSSTGTTAADVDLSQTQLRSLFHYQPDLSGARQREAALTDEYQGDRAALSAALIALNQRLGAPEPALAAARRLAEPAALAVVTGQQAGILTGPLYTLYKAAGAIALARKLERELGRPVVPVFWAATEDHDLAEADHTWLLRPDEHWQRLRYRPSASVEGLSVGAVPLARTELDVLLDTLSRTMPGGRSSAALLTMAAATGHASATIGEWFCRLVAAIYGPLGLVVLDPMEPSLRQLAATGVGEVLERADALADGLAAGEAAVSALGFATQLKVSAADAQLFYYPEGPTGPRQALGRTPAGFELRDGAGQWVATELRDIAGSEPERFSGNVVTRPLLQDYMLPTLAYVAGPGEIAYYAMLKGCYEAVGRTMPLIWPRPSHTVVEPAVAHLLRKRGLEAPDLPAALDRAAQAAIAATDGLGIEELFGGMRRGIEALYEPVVPAAAEFDAVLGSLAVKNRERVLRETEWLRKKSWQVARQRATTALGQIDRIRTHLWPHGGPQERSLCGLYYLARYGLGLAAELADIDPGPPFEHRFLFVG